MSRKLKAVIGAQWGDEGKGVITDYLSSSSSLVVRFNGGAQAGHTVITPESKRHIFHHVGAGTFKGAQTFLSSYFIVNPIIFAEEWRLLRDLPVSITADPFCYVTTPYDIMLNQAVEKSRGDKRHGSCGLGFNETIHRSKVFSFFLSDFTKPRDIKCILETIRDKYVPLRATELGLELSSLPYLYDEKVITQYIEDTLLMRDLISLHTWTKVASEWKGDIVFEGAQGLQLDKDNESQFPHVTNSKTGLFNVLELMNQASLTDSLDAYYVTRTYMTRHGAGSMPHEYDVDYAVIDDQTNVENENQGKMRFSWLDLDYLRQAMVKEFVLPNVMLKHIKYFKDDLSQNHSTINFNLAMTCVDQLQDGTLGYINFFKKHKATVKEMVASMRKDFGFDKILLSYGPTRKDVVEQ